MMTYACSDLDGHGDATRRYVEVVGWPEMFTGKCAGTVVSIDTQTSGPCDCPCHEAPEYPTWRPSYSNEDFDRAQEFASALTSRDREAGLPAPRGGYSMFRFEQARRAVSAAVTA